MISHAFRITGILALLGAQSPAQLECDFARAARSLDWSAVVNGNQWLLRSEPNLGSSPATMQFLHETAGGSASTTVGLPFTRNGEMREISAPPGHRRFILSGLNITSFQPLTAHGVLCFLSLAPGGSTPQATISGVANIGPLDPISIWVDDHKTAAVVYVMDYRSDSVVAGLATDLEGTPELPHSGQFTTVATAASLPILTNPLALRFGRHLGPEFGFRISRPHLGWPEAVVAKNDDTDLNSGWSFQSSPIGGLVIQDDEILAAHSIIQVSFPGAGTFSLTQDGTPIANGTAAGGIQPLTLPASTLLHPSPAAHYKLSGRAHQLER